MGCTDTDTVTVTVNSLPTIDAGEDAVACFGDEVTLTATSDGTIAWDQGVANDVPFIPEASGDYIATATSDMGCTDTDTVTVTVNPLPEADAGADQDICAGESVTLQASGGTSYTWNNGLSNGDSVTPDKDTTIEVTVTNELGCSTTDELFIGIIEVDTSVTRDGTLLIANANDASYQWIDCATGNLVTGETGKSFTPETNGIYAVEVTQNSCTASSSCYVVTGIVSVPVDPAARIHYYPNPTQGPLKLDLGREVDEVQVRISDMSGKQLLINIFHGSRIIDLNLQSYNPGFYLVEVIGPEEKSILKVLKVN